MSSAMNHRKRSYRSERIKRSAFSAMGRRAYYWQVSTPQKRNIFGRLASFLRRKIIASSKPKEDET